MRIVKSKSQLFFEKTKKWYFYTDSLNLATRKFNILTRKDECFKDYFFNHFKSFFDKKDKFYSYFYYLSNLLYKPNAFNINSHFINLSIELILYKIYVQFISHNLNFNLDDDNIYIAFTTLCNHIHFD